MAHKVNPPLLLIPFNVDFCSNFTLQGKDWRENTLHKTSQPFKMEKFTKLNRFMLFQGEEDLIMMISMNAISNDHNPHTTTVKNARYMRSVSRAKLRYFEGIFKLWTHDQQLLPFPQMFISFANQNLAVLCVKRSWKGIIFSWNFFCCMWSIKL